MGQEREYIVSCWYCSAPFNAFESALCKHAAPSRVCPFCLHCICDAPESYRTKYWQECPAELLDVSGAANTGESPKIGELLIKAGKIDRQQLKEAIQTQQITKQKLGEIFIMMELLTPQELKLYLLNQKIIDEIELEPYMMNKELARRLGKEFCLKYNLVPLEYNRIGNERILRFAIPAKNNLAAIKNSKRLQKIILIPYLAAKEKVEAILSTMKEELEWENLLKDETTFDDLLK